MNKVENKKEKWEDQTLCTKTYKKDFENFFF